MILHCQQSVSRDNFTFQLVLENKYHHQMLLTKEVLEILAIE